VYVSIRPQIGLRASGVFLFSQYQRVMSTCVRHGFAKTHYEQVVQKGDKIGMCPHIDSGLLLHLVSKFDADFPWPEPKVDLFMYCDDCYQQRNAP
jgi:hypothetical protein